MLSSFKKESSTNQEGGKMPVVVGHFGFSSEADRIINEGNKLSLKCMMPLNAETKHPFQFQFLVWLLKFLKNSSFNYIFSFKTVFLFEKSPFSKNSINYADSDKH